MFIKILNELLAENDLTYTTLAKKLNIPQTTISNWKNRGSSPNIDDLIKISDYFNTSIDYLVGRESDDAVMIKTKSKIEELYEKLNRQNQIMVLGYVTALLQKQNNMENY